MNYMLERELRELEAAWEETCLYFETKQQRLSRAFTEARREYEERKKELENY